MSLPSIELPAARESIRPWRQSMRSGTADDRKLSEVTVSIPAALAAVDISVPSVVSVTLENAVQAIARLDSDHGVALTPLNYLLVRSESIASSKIESEEAPLDAFVRALYGSKANSSATAMANAKGALDVLTSGELTLDALLRAHALLLADDPNDARHAGALRSMQNWIGGSDHSPRGALYVPPPPDRVPALMDDLLAFAGRSDIPVIAQAAIAHAQFEAIHPFTDGNGRIGRALAAGILRARGLTTQVTVPVAAALAEVRPIYFAALRSFHRGDASPIVDLWARSSVIAAEESQVTVARLASLPSEWADILDHPRPSSALSRVVGYLAHSPVFTVDEIEDSLRLPSTSAARAVGGLAAAGIIRGLTDRRRNQVWGADSVLTELEDMGLRIGTRARDEI